MIEFNGTDLIVENPVDDASMRRALATSLGIAEERVILIEDLAGYPDRALADVVCVASPVAGEFSRLFSIQTEPLKLPYDAALDPVQRICELLDTRCLVPDESVDPYCMWLVSPGAAPRNVAMDVGAMDDGRYIVSSR